MKMNSRMKSKMDEKWMKKANCEQPYCSDVFNFTVCKRYGIHEFLRHRAFRYSAIRVLVPCFKNNGRTLLAETVTHIGSVIYIGEKDCQLDPSFEIHRKEIHQMSILFRQSLSMHHSTSVYFGEAYNVL